VCLNCGKKFAYRRTDIGCNGPGHRTGRSAFVSQRSQ
jgi:hypothetical protein